MSQTMKFTNKLNANDRTCDLIGKEQKEYYYYLKQFFFFGNYMSS